MKINLFALTFDDFNFSILRSFAPILRSFLVQILKNQKIRVRLRSGALDLQSLRSLWCIGLFALSCTLLRSDALSFLKLSIYDILTCPHSTDLCSVAIEYSVIWVSVYLL